jgi:hypothetical protein
MGLTEMLDWLAMTPRFRDDTQTSPGRGGLKERLFQTVVQAYRAQGKALFLALEPEVQQQYDAGIAQHRLQLLPEAQRPGALLQMQGFQQRVRQAERTSLGVPARPTIGP